MNNPKAALEALIAKASLAKTEEKQEEVIKDTVDLLKDSMYKRFMNPYKKYGL